MRGNDDDDEDDNEAVIKHTMHQAPKSKVLEFKLPGSTGPRPSQVSALSRATDAKATVTIEKSYDFAGETIKFEKTPHLSLRMNVGLRRSTDDTSQSCSASCSRFQGGQEIRRAAEVSDDELYHFYDS